ncbi:unnamed protein product [Closterium sp. NIES-54]
MAPNAYYLNSVLWDLRGGKDMQWAMWEIPMLPWKEAAARSATEAVREGHASHVTSGGGDGSDGGLHGALPSVTPSMDWLPMVERESGKQVKAIRSDCGGEFLGVEFRSWLKWHGIKQQLTTAFTPQSNGMAERANRTIIEGGRTILVDSGLPLRFWPLAIRHATVIKNWVLTHVGGQHWVSMEKWSGKKPVVDMLRVFGCMGLVHVPKEKRDKLQAAAAWAVHLELTEVSHDLGGAEGEAEDVEGALQQGEAPVAERGDTEEELQQPTPSPQLPPRRTTQGKSDAVCDGAKEGEAKEMPKSCPPKGFSQV